MTDFQTCVIGAGVVGLAVAAELATKGHEVLVIERANTIGSQTSSRNSEVIHAGIYYPKNSLKARFCVEGKQLLYKHCKDYYIAHDRIGKLIVATHDAQLEKLASIKKHAIANGVDDLEFKGDDKCHELEPRLQCVGGIFSPSTGIIDSHGFMLSLQGILENHGGQIAFDTAVDRIESLSSGGFSLATSNAGESFSISSKNLIVCAGLHTTDLLRSLSVQNEFGFPQTRFAKGNYFRLDGKAPFKHLIYPVPEAGGLGVHLTLDLAGQARFGPDVEWVDSIDYEVSHQRADKFHTAIRRYWPDLPNNSLQPEYAGIRPKLTGPGEGDSDFAIFDQSTHGMKGLLTLMGIESPGLTSSLALGKYVAQFF